MQHNNYELRRPHRPAGLTTATRAGSRAGPSFVFYRNMANPGARTSTCLEFICGSGISTAAPAMVVFYSLLANANRRGTTC